MFAQRCAYIFPEYSVVFYVQVLWENIIFGFSKTFERLIDTLFLWHLKTSKILKATFYVTFRRKIVKLLRTVYRFMYGYNYFWHYKNAQRFRDARTRKVAIYFVYMQTNKYNFQFE